MDEEEDEVAPMVGVQDLLHRYRGGSPAAKVSVSKHTAIINEVCV